MRHYQPLGSSQKWTRNDSATREKYPWYIIYWWKSMTKECLKSIYRPKLDCCLNEAFIGFYICGVCVCHFTVFPRYENATRTPPQNQILVTPLLITICCAFGGLRWKKHLSVIQQVVWWDKTRVLLLFIHWLFSRSVLIIIM